MKGSIQLFTVVYTFALFFTGNNVFGFGADLVETSIIIVSSVLVATFGCYAIKGARLKLKETLRLAVGYTFVIVALKIASGIVIVTTSKTVGLMDLRYLEAGAVLAIDAIQIFVWTVIFSFFLDVLDLKIKSLLVRLALALCHRKVGAGHNRSAANIVNIYSEKEHVLKKTRNDSLDIVLPDRGIVTYGYSSDVREAPCSKKSFPSLQSFLLSAMDDFIRMNVRPGAARMLDFHRRGIKPTLDAYAQGYEEDRKIVDGYLQSIARYIRESNAIRLMGKHFV